MNSNNSNIINGLSQAEVEERKKQGLTNKTTLVVGKTTWEILATNVFSLFNIVLFVVAGLLIYAEQYSSLFFIVILLSNIIIGLIEDFHARHLMKKTRLLSQAEFEILRDGKRISAPSSEIVLDDIVYLKESYQVPADFIIIKGTIGVNEAQLTGEGLTIYKKEGDDVLSGSIVVTGTCIAKAIRVGNESFIQTLSSKAKKFKRPKSQIIKNLRILFRYISAMVVILGAATAIIYAMQGKFSDADSFKQIIGSIAGSTVAMVPSGLFLLTSAALAVGVISLSKKRTSVQELYSIEMLARTDVLCVDKTGTITDGTMSLTEIVAFDDSSDSKIRQIVRNILNATKDDNLTARALNQACGYEATAVATKSIPFNSEIKYSAASFGTKGTYILGAPEFINLKNKDSVLYRCNEYTSKGYRVLVLAHSFLSIDREIFDSECVVIALLILKDNIKPDALKTFQWFKENGVAIKVISGDDPRTVSEIAKSAGIVNAENYISLYGKKQEEVEELVGNYSVFGRVAPEQKEIIIRKLKEQKHVVAMTGDGVNDILALKTADCSIAMASGSEAARNVSHIVLLDSDFSRLPDIVAEGRRVINNLQRTASLFLTKTIFAIAITIMFLILGIINSSYTYPFTTNNMYVWEMLSIGMPSFFIALQPNFDEINSDSFLKNVFRKAVPAAIVQIVCVVIFFTLYLLRINKLGYFGLSGSDYRDGLTVGYAQTLAMCVLSFSVISSAILLKICFPLDKYRGIVYGVSATCVVGILTGIGTYSYLGNYENNILNLGIGYLNTTNWSMFLVVVICALAVYFYGTFVYETILKRKVSKKNNDKN